MLNFFKSPFLTVCRSIRGIDTLVSAVIFKDVNPGCTGKQCTAPLNVECQLCRAAPWCHLGLFVLGLCLVTVNWLINLLLLHNIFYLWYRTGILSLDFINRSVTFFPPEGRLGVLGWSSVRAFVCSFTFTLYRWPHTQKVWWFLI